MNCNIENDEFKNFVYINNAQFDLLQLWDVSTVLH